MNRIQLLQRAGMLILLFLTSLQKASGQNYVLTSSCDGSVHIGGSCTLSCDTRDTSHDAIKWLDRSVTRTVIKSTCSPTLPFPSDYSVTCPLGNSTVFTVTFTNAKFKSDTKSWRCDFVFGGRESNTVDIVVNVPLSSVSIFRSNTSITCVATSSPLPSITLYRDGSMETTSPPAVEGSAGWTATLVYSLSECRDNSIYWCLGSNGEISVNSTVSYPDEPPEVPVDVSMTLNGSSVHVTWYRGYNGGLPQTFTVEYSLDKTVWTAGGSEAEVEDQERYEVVISNLESSMEYYVRVRASNKLGFSPFYQIVYVTTVVKQIVSETCRTDNLGKGIGIGFGICIPFMFALVVGVVWMYRRGITTGRNQRNQAQRDKALGNIDPAQAPGPAPAPVDGSMYEGFDNTTRTQDYAELQVYENAKV